ncbi:MAG: hypothetical protein WDN02_02210 [Methylovirgula sp.]|uniref:hypothetical protein n=1 Tax=Methylovirgula sp. TaxID=1978224 RepID=UPI003076197E
MSRWVLALAAAALLGSASMGFAQQSTNDWAYPPLHVHGHHHWHSGYYNRPCSIDQRDYAYINQCGELIPSIWDRTPVMGG